MKKTLLLIAAVALVVVVPASAQQAGEEEQNGAASQTVVVTGVVEKPEITTYMYGSHAITDEATGAGYALRSEEEELLDGYIGQRVTVYGIPVPEYEGGAVEGGPPLLEVTRVEQAGSVGSDPGVDLNEDGRVDEADGRLAAEISDAARSASDSIDQPALPATGGP